VTSLTRTPPPLTNT